MKIVKVILSILVLVIALDAKSLDLSIGKFINQKSITSIHPEPASTDVAPHTDIKINFNVQLDTTRNKDISFKLKRIDEKKGFMFFKNFESIDGELSYEKDDKQLLFKSNKLLESGIYEVYVKHLKSTQKGMRKNIKHISFRFSVADTIVESLNIRPNPIELEVDTNISISTNITYSDGSSHDVGADSCTLEDETIAKIESKTLTALKDGVTTLSCKYKNLTTKDTSITSYLIINGHKLPPMPDETLNNSTLLGIDINNNDVRDDVEIWIYKKYKDKHPIHIDIAMQKARGYKKVLETPERAREITGEVGSAMVCEWYYEYDAKYFNEKILVTEKINTKYFRKNIYFNTDERDDTYNYYDSLLSGGVYKLPKDNEEKSYCDFNTSKYEE